MTSSQDSSSTERLVAALVAAYILAEQDLLAGLTAIIRRTTPDLEGRQLLIVKARTLVRRILNRLDSRTAGIAVRMLDSAARDGAAAAIADVGSQLAVRLPSTGGAGGGGAAGGDRWMRFGDEPFDLSLPHGERAAQAIRDDIVSELADVRTRITRLPDDVYKAIAPHGAIYQVIDNDITPAQAQAMAWRVFVSQGVTGFTDKSGRNWSLSAYVEMAVRTAAQRAFNDSHLARMQALGVEYFTVPDSGHPCPKCFPWQGRVLTAREIPNPTIHVDGTIAEATAAGLFHPNAILGDQPVQVLGAAENGVKAWYSGPSVNVTTASGVHLTVSPNHPVLTATGWLPAKFLHQGMQVFRAAHGGFNDTPGTDEHLDHGVSSIEQVLDALAATGGRTTVPASADDLHGDGRFVQGEIDVVVADRRLMPVVHARAVHVRSDDTLPRPDVQATLCPSHRAETLRALAVERSVAGPLPQFDASTLHAPADRRAADAGTVSEILAGLPCEVAADQVVNVEFDWYEGHAFDLQTSTGAYLSSTILVHNCRHPLTAVFPGVTVLPEPREWTAEDQRLYDLSQKQRRLELDVRKAKRQLEYAASPEAAADARAQVRRRQAKVREFVAETGFARQSRREQLDLTDARIKLPTPIR